MRKSLIIGLTVLSLMLCAGTAYPIEGPSATVVFPLICEVPTNSKGMTPEHLDMVFTIANVTNFDTHVIALVRNFKSILELDFAVHLTPYDVSSNTCLGVMNMMSPATKAAMVETIDGVQYYVGYIRYDVEEPPAGALIGWGEMKTLSTLVLGGGTFKVFKEWLFTDTGFNGVPDFYSLVNAADTIHPCSYCNWQIISNQKLMPRYKIANNDPDTHNWWVIMTPSDALSTANGTCTRALECIICDEQEDCVSNAIPIPYQVNIVNVADILPALFATFPKAGFAMCDVVLVGTSVNDQNPCGNAGNEQYLGWSYQYTNGSGNLRTALIFPMHRQVGQVAVGPPGQ